MEILSVSLKNFKFHSDRAFSFQPGTNAICGENGAGKTSILEAIAWVLFDHTGAYTKEDLIRNGANSAQVRVSFVSSRDQRTYDISRCTRSSYTIYDPELGEKLNYTKKEDVLPWLREHLGVPAGTNLSQLFRNTIGVPQGTFTVDFLGTAEERKKVFDPILKVEEYKKVYKELGDLEKFAKAQSEKLDRDIQQYDEQLQEWDELSQRKATLSGTIKQIQTDLKQWEEQYDRLKSDQEKYTAIASQVQQLTTNLESLSSRIRSDELNLDRLKSELEAAEKSVKICTERRDSYQAYLQIEEALKEFDRSRSQQEKLLLDRQKRANTLSVCESKIAVLAQKEERRSQLEADLKQLEPLIKQQSELEQQQKQLNEQLQNCQSWRQTLQREEKRLAQLQDSQKQLSNEIERLEGLGAIVKQIPQLEEQLQRYQQQLSRIEAATQFEGDLRQILVQAQKRGDIQTQQIQTATVTLKELQQATPTLQSQLATVLTALENSSKHSAFLMQDLQGILDDLSQQTLVDRLKQSLKETQTQLKLYRDQEAQYRGLEAKFDQEERLDAEVTELRSLITEHQSQVVAEPELKSQLATITEQLEALESPRDRSRYLQRDLNELSELVTERTLLESEFNTAQAAIRKIDEALEPFENLAEQIQEQQNLRDRYRSDYQAYLEHQKSANSYKERKIQLEDAIAQLEQYQEQLKTLTNQKAQLEETYDPEEVKRIHAEYQ
ncbi:SMC family ATPase, partial [Pseudanabaenaceae cyanobacterium LEGE 13415]|nr:SMC family ATPase [Pseudanabaenaceae cyanobacterium LEGE 13415]